MPTPGPHVPSVVIVTDWAGGGPEEVLCAYVEKATRERHRTTAAIVLNRFNERL